MQATAPPSTRTCAHRLRLEGDLHGALENDQLRVWFQPQVELATGQMVGVEALVRWEHPEFGLLGPDEFISLGEETGLIVEIDTWVLREACRQVAPLGGAGPGGATRRGQPVDSRSPRCLARRQRGRGVGREPA